MISYRGAHVCTPLQVGGLKASSLQGLVFVTHHVINEFMIKKSFHQRQSISGAAHQRFPLASVEAAGATGITVIRGSLCLAQASPPARRGLVHFLLWSQTFIPAIPTALRHKLFFLAGIF